MNDLLIICDVTVAKQANLSMLDVLKQGFTQEDVNEDVAKVIIEFDKLPMRWFEKQGSR